MATLTENITQAVNDFRAIGTALKNKNLPVLSTTHTSEYAGLINDLVTYNIQPFQEWINYSGLDFTDYSYEKTEDILNDNTTIGALGGKTVFEYLINNEASAAYAAYLKESIANLIKSKPLCLKKALLSSNKNMFLNSRFDFDEHIDDVIERNPIVNQENYQGIVTCSSDRSTNPTVDNPDYGYYCWNAFNGGIDSSDNNIIFGDRGVWSAFGANQWVQYKYNTAKYLYKVRIYSLRDNAPAGVIIEGSNDGENFEVIAEQDLSGIIGADHYDEIICCNSTPYQYFRFTITDNVHSGTCGVGEIEIYSFREEE